MGMKIEYVFEVVCMERAQETVNEVQGRGIK
jgi:hypothetical protein